MNVLRDHSISVVLPTANRHTTIFRAVEAIYKNSIAPDEMIVVDQSSNHLTEDVLQEFIEVKGLIYIKDKGKGISRGRNVGWQKAAGSIIAFTDDDAWVRPDWLESILFAFKNAPASVGVVGGKIIPVYEEINPAWSIPKQWEYLLPSRDCGDSVKLFEPGSYPMGVNFATYRDLLDKFNGFDENMGVNNARSIQIFGEDVDYFERIKQEGITLLYVPDCVVYHPVPLSRQSQTFLNKRLLVEGTTYAYNRIKRGELNVFGSLVSAFKTAIKYVLVLLTKGNNEEAHYLYGKMLVLVKLGVFQLQL